MRRAAYTLLEVMLVLLIIGLLASVVAPRIVGRGADARRTKARADMHAIAQALNLYRLDAGVYPTTAQGLQALVTAPTIPPVPPAWNAEGYVERMPVDPWGTGYVYLRTAPHRFRLLSLGADAREGGDGDDADLEYGDE